MRDTLGEFEQLGCKVFGISTDSPFALDSWARSQNYPFPLLSDYNKEVSPAYDSMYSELLGFKGVCKRSAYVIDGQDDAFVGDAVQVHGAANGFPGYVDPDAYRSSLRYLRDEVRPRHLYLGHPYRTAAGTSYGLRLDRKQAAAALTESLDVEARVRDAAEQAVLAGLTENDSPYSPFDSAAAALGYTGDPRLEPSPFFTTLHGYRARLTRQL